MGLHALDSMNEHSPTSEVIGLLLRRDGALNTAPRPEGMHHRPPGVRGVGPEVRCTVLSYDKTGGGAGERQIHQAVLVDGGFDGVRSSLLVQCQGEVVSFKGEHVLIEHEVVQGVGVPDVRLIAFEVKDL